MGESPGLGGYPDLAKPRTRITQAWQHMWTRLLIEVPNDAHKAITAAHMTKTVLARTRQAGR